MKDVDGVGVINLSVRLGDLWNRCKSGTGDSNLLILNISIKHVCLYKLCTVSKLFFLNNGFVCSFS